MSKHHSFLLSVACLGFFCTTGTAQGISNQIVVERNILVSTPQVNELHYEVAVASHPKKPILLGGSMIVSEVSGFTSVVYVSRDGGTRWEPKLKIGRPDQDVDQTDPAVAFGPDDTLYFISNARTPEPGVRAYANLYRSQDEGESWKAIGEFPFFDRPFIVVDDSDTRSRGTIYVVGKAANFGSGIIEDRTRAIYSVAISNDSGKTFKYSRFLMPVGQIAPPFVLSDGTAVFLMTENVSGVEDAKEGVPNIILKAVTTSDAGVTFGKPAVLARYSQPASHGMWSSHPVYSLAGDRTSGPFKSRLYAVYAGSQPGKSQIALVYSSDKGRTWSKSTIVSEHGSKKSVPRISFMPMVSVNSKGVVGVTWYDRSESENGLDFNVRFAASLDGGETFLPSVKVSDKAFTHSDDGQWVLHGYAQGGGHKHPWNPAVDGGSLKIQVSEGAISHHYGGQTAGLSADAAGGFHPFWIDNRTGTPQVWTATVKVNGNVVRNGSTELSDLEDLSEKFVLRVEQPHYDRQSKTLSVDIRIQNVSQEPIRGPLKARVVSLKSDAVAMLKENGRSLPAVGAVIDLSSLLEGGELPPMGMSKSVKRLEFAMFAWPSLVEKLQEGDFGLQIVNLELKIFGKPLSKISLKH
jgi:hypothetical protein